MKFSALMLYRLILFSYMKMSLQVNLVFLYEKVTLVTKKKTCNEEQMTT